MTDPIESLRTSLAGRYTVERELGRGGAATVYLATDVKHERKVALKVLRPEIAAMVGPERFLREIKTTAQLSNPHILPLLDSGEAPGTMFYVMPYVEGESLRDRMQREKQLPLSDAISITEDVAAALAYAHGRGIIHRDIKPENILLSGGTAVVADFGIAKALSSGGGQKLTETGLAIGTPAYMSPEQSMGGEVLDARSDIYSLGCVTYEMLTGEAPFTGPTAQAVIFKRLKEPVPHVSTLRQVPAAVEHAVTKALAREAVDRWGSAQEYATAFKAEPPPASAAARIARPRLQRWLLGVIAFGALVASVVMFKLIGSPPRASGAADALPKGMVQVPARPYPLFGGNCDFCLKQQTVRLEGFYIDQTEVTVGAYAAYVASGRAPEPWRLQNLTINGAPGRLQVPIQPPDSLPVTGVMEAEAEGFCHWRDSLASLPNEMQWEAAARSVDQRTYPWGGQWVRGNANADSLRSDIAPVGSYPAGASPAGAVDMSGNVWEWTSTAMTMKDGKKAYIIRGGAYDSPPSASTTFYRVPAIVVPESQRQASYGKTGFRCVRKLR